MLNFLPISEWRFLEKCCLYKKACISQNLLCMLTLDNKWYFSNQCHGQTAKSGGQTLGQNTGKSDYFFFVWFQQLNKICGWRGELLCFLYWTGIFFNLNKITKVNKEDISSMYDFNFFQQSLAMVCSTKREQFVWTWKGIPNNRYCPSNSVWNTLHL